LPTSSPRQGAAASCPPAGAWAKPPASDILVEKRATNLNFDSPSVSILSERFPGPGKIRVLDLGAPTHASVAFFSGSPCTYYVEDLYRFFIEPRKQGENGDGEDVAAAIADALGYGYSVRFNLVLGWDLFSYMDRGAIKILMSRVAQSCRTGTLLFLTAPTGATIPSEPARIAMVRPGSLDYRSAFGVQSMPNPRFSPSALESMMPGFRLLHSFLLRGEMQEFLFRYA
jgi:hypothetical protein